VKIKILCSFFIFLLTVTTGKAESVYLTFVDPSGGPIQKGQVSLKLEELDSPVSDLVLIDTANRSPEILSHPAGRRLYVFVFDFLFSSPDSLLQARKTTEAFINAIDKTDLIAVAGITGQDGLKMYCVPTVDRNKVFAGLNLMGQKKVEGMMEGPEGNLYPEQFTPNTTPVALVPDETFAQNIKTYAISEKEKKEARPVLLQSVADLGFLLSSLKGRKHVILFTPGSDTGGLSINLPLRDKAPKKKKGQLDQPVEIAHEDFDSITDTSLTEERVQAKASAGPRKRPRKEKGETLPDLVAGTDAHVHIFHGGAQEHDLFKQLASRTGGNFYAPGTDTNTAIRQILSSDKTYYAIKVEAATDKMKDLNTVKLQVQGKEVLSSHKWLIPKTPANFTSMEKKAKIAENIYKPEFKTPKHFHFWTDFVLDPGGSRIPSFVQIDGPQVLQTKEEIIDLEFYAFATDETGAVLDCSYFVFSLDLTNKSLQERLKSSGIKIWNVLLGNMKASSVHWTILNLQTSEMFSQSVPVTGLNTDMTMTQPFFPSMNLNWMAWPNPMQNQTKRGIPISYPYIEGKDMVFFPEFSPVLKRTDEKQVVFLRVFNLPVPGKIPRMKMALVDSAGKTTDVPVLGLMQNPTAMEAGGMGMFWQLGKLPEIVPGNYRLRVSTFEPAQNKEIIREVTATVQ